MTAPFSISSKSHASDLLRCFTGVCSPRPTLDFGGDLRSGLGPGRAMSCRWGTSRNWTFNSEAPGVMPGRFAALVLTLLTLPCRKFVSPA